MGPGKHSFFGGARRGYHHGQLKDALVEAARRLVTERGPAGLTLAEAAKLAGVTSAAPYRHFADREALMGELARRGFRLFGEQLGLAWRGGEPDARSALRRMGRAYLMFAQAEPGLYMAMFGNGRALNAPEPGEAADQALERLRGAVAEKLRQAGAAHVDSRALALQIWALSHGVAMLMIAGMLGPECESTSAADILARGSESLFEGAVRAGPPVAPPPDAGPWGRKA